MNLFSKCINVVLSHEGGFQDSHRDLGNWIGGYQTGQLVGTKYGIAARFFPNVDIKNLTVERAKQIYFRYYWIPMNLDGICREASALEMFDFGVNAGKGRAIRAAQRLAGAVVDGICGENTRYAINNYPGDFVRDYKDTRREYYKYIATKRDNHIFLIGWLNRVDSTKF